MNPLYIKGILIIIKFIKVIGIINFKPFLIKLLYPYKSLSTVYINRVLIAKLFSHPACIIHA